VRGDVTQSRRKTKQAGELWRVSTVADESNWTRGTSLREWKRVVGEPEGGDTRPSFYTREPQRVSDGGLKKKTSIKSAETAAGRS